MNRTVYYVLFYILFAVTYYLNIYLIKLKINKQNNYFISLIDIIILLSFISINYILDLKNVMIIKTIFFYVTLMIYMIITYRYSFKDVLKGCVFILLIGILSELLSGILFGIIINISTSNLYILLLVRTICYIQFFLITLFFIIIINKSLRFQYIKNISVKVLLVLFSLFIVIGTLNYLGTYKFNNTIYYLFIMLLIFIIMGGFIINKLTINNYNKINEIRNLKEKNNEVQKYINDFKLYKHDLRYKLLSIKEYGNKKVNESIDHLLDKNDNELSYINNFNEIPSSLIHIFSDRLSINNDNNIEVIINNSLTNKEMNVNEKYYLPLYEVLGNSLTNAIESLPEVSPVLYITFYDHNNSYVIEIVNNFRNNVDMEIIGHVNYSTKSRNSGYGLNSMFCNKSISVNGIIINDLFKIKIIIPK